MFGCWDISKTVFGVFRKKSDFQPPIVQGDNTEIIQTGSQLSQLWLLADVVYVSLLLDVIENGMAAIKPRLWYGSQLNQDYGMAAK